MIKQVKMFTVVCDNCGLDSNKDAEYSAWNDSSYAEDVATESGWVKDDDNHYCPDCVSYDDDDNLVINHIRKDMYMGK